MNETGDLETGGRQGTVFSVSRIFFGQETENRPLSPLQCMEEIKYAS